MRHRIYVGWKYLLWCVVMGYASAVPAAASGSIEVRDDGGHILRFSQPPRRVISLAPHTTELLFAAGAGAQVVAVSAYSDYPPVAQSLPQIGDSRQLDIERILALKPDLLVVWASGTPARQLAQLEKLGIPMFYSEPRKLQDIPDSVLRLGRLLGTTDQARSVADDFKKTLEAIRQKYRQRRVIRLFYPISDNPLYTLNGEHIVNDAFIACGAQNVFADLPVLAPSVSVEAVLLKNPEAIILSQAGKERWRQFSGLLAVQRENLITVDSNLLTRASPRMLGGVRILCERLDFARRLPPPKGVP